MSNDDDESPSTPLPNHFLLSTYKENLPMETSKTMLSYKCRLCQQILDNPILTCSTCVNTGQFCSSKHGTSENNRRQMLLNMLNKTDYEEFQKYSTHESTHLQCSDRMFLLKKFNAEKTILQAEYQTKINSSIEARQMSGQIQQRKNRLHLINDSIERLREKIEQKKQLNIETQERTDETGIRIKTLEKKLNNINKILQLSNNEIRKRIDIRITEEKKLNKIRRERFHELHKYLFPIQRLSSTDDALVTRIKDLMNAQQTSVDETNDNAPIVTDYTYQIVDSCLASNRNYQIDNLVLTYNTDITADESDSPQLSPSFDSYQILSALSHACQLIRIIAFYLHINLPFRLHPGEFNADKLTVDCLRADIAKLNTNIISSCLSQGIPIDDTDVTSTLQNLLKLLTFQTYPSRIRPVIYPSKYIDMIETEVNEISRIMITEYWFDDDNDDTAKDGADILNNAEWVALSQIDDIPDDPSIEELNGSSPSTSTQRNPSMIGSSIDYLKKRLWDS